MRGIRVLAAAAAVLLTAGLSIAPGTAAAAPASASAPASAPWSWPTSPHRVVRGYLAPATAYGPGHRGIDVAAARSAPVLAPADGVVVFAGPVAGRGVVSIEHAGGVRSSLEPVVPTVRVGEAVQRGEVVAVLGTGGAHPAGVLHLGARVPTGGGLAYVSPLLLLGGLPRAVLLPLDR